VPAQRQSRKHFHSAVRAGHRGVAWPSLAGRLFFIQVDRIETPRKSKIQINKKQSPNPNNLKATKRCNNFIRLS